MSAQLGDVSFDRHGTTAIGVVSGEIDMSNAASVLERVASFVTPDDEALVLDLSALGFIDSAGLHALFELHATLGERRQRLALALPHGGHVARTVEIVGLPETIAVHETREEAIAAARADAQEARPFEPGPGA
jgi:anti-sigma B factor antagonist